MTWAPSKYKTWKLKRETSRKLERGTKAQEGKKTLLKRVAISKSASIEILQKITKLNKNGGYLFSPFSNLSKR